MTARVGLGLLITALVALAAWLVVGAVSASAEPRTPTDAWGAADASVTAPLVPGGGAPAVQSGATPNGCAGRLVPAGGGATGGGAGAGGAETTDAGDAGDAGGADPGGAPTGVTGVDTAGCGAGADASAGDTATRDASGAAAADAAGAPDSGTPAGAPAATAAVDAVDPAWAAGVAQATGIPQRAVIGYAGAALALRSEQPSCGLGWNTVAALGWIESGHGTHGGSTIGATDGVTTPRILGPALDGGEFDAIDDTDAGTLDGDVGGDRAVGPLQFIPSTWQRWGADGSGDGVADPQQIDDASLAAARYLCHYGDLADAGTWRTAVFAYNHVESYVDSVAATANQYAAQAASVPIAGGPLP